MKSLFSEGLLTLPSRVAARIDMGDQSGSELHAAVLRIAEGLIGEFVEWIEAGGEVLQGSRDRLWKLGEYESANVAWTFVDDIVGTCHEVVIERAVVAGRADLPRLSRGLVEVCDAMYDSYWVYDDRAAVEQVMRMGMIAERLITPVFMLDADGKLTFANDALVRLVNIPEGRLLGRSLDEVLGRGISVEERNQADLVMVDAHDEERHFHIISFNVVGPAGSEYFGQLFERTDQVRLDLAKDQLMSVISHELRTPLTSVIGYAELLAIPGGLEEEDRAFAAASMSEDAQLLLHIIDDLVLFSGLETNRIDVDPVVVSAAALFDRVVRRSGIDPDHLTIEMDPSLEIYVDPKRFEQLIGNLLTNTSRYGAPPVRISAASLGSGTLIRVSDNGPGIPAAERPHIFDSFYQGSARKAGTGSGLGLAICRSIVRSHGATIELERGEGTSFLMRFPGSAAG